MVMTSGKLELKLLQEEVRKLQRVYDDTIAELRRLDEWDFTTRDQLITKANDIEDMINEYRIDITMAEAFILSQKKS